jgi:hypothetical protein
MKTACLRQGIVFRIGARLGKIKRKELKNVPAVGVNVLRFIRNFGQYIEEIRPVLCVAKDETSVDIMCRTFCCNFLRKSRLWQSWLARRLTPDVATVYER